MASTTALLSVTAVILLSLNHFTTAETPEPPQAFLNAAETVSYSCSNAMSSSSLLSITTTKASSHPTLTIFSPPDSSFETSGQPLLNLLLLHFSPLFLALSSLSSLPYGTKIPTLSYSGSSLFITSQPGNTAISINNVNITGSPVYDDGSVIVYAIEDFFTPNFTIKNSIQNPQSTTPKRTKLAPFWSLLDASVVLKSRGYSIMASLLELQLMGHLKFSRRSLKMNPFAPEDGSPNYRILSSRHLLPWRVDWWGKLNGVSNKTVFNDCVEWSRIMNKRDYPIPPTNGFEPPIPNMKNIDLRICFSNHDQVREQPDHGTEEEEEVEGEDSGLNEDESLSPVRNEL